MKFFIKEDNYQSALIQDLDPQVQIYTPQSLRDEDISFQNGDAILSPSENTLDLILQKTQDPILKAGILELKDKYLFRSQLSSFYPNYIFKKVKLSELPQLELPTNKEFILKPCKGFFGIGVTRLNASMNLVQIQVDLAKQLKQGGNYFADTVLSHEEFILEQYIEGEEYAVDLYFDNEGIPVILNITHHPLPHNIKYFHSLYYSHHTLFDRFQKKFLDFFTKLNKQLHLKNFPIHAEFKGENDELIPIEVNPLRFGGFGLSDLCYHMTGENPYNCFYKNESIKWNKFWEGVDDFYAWTLAYNGLGINLQEQSPNHQAYQNYLENLIHYLPLDHQNNPAFAIAYIRMNKESDIEKYTNTDFSKFFTK